MMPTSAGSSRPLLGHHAEHLRRSGLDDATIIASGCWSASAQEVARICGRDAAKVGPGLVIPYPGCGLPDGTPFCRVRLDKPMLDDDGNGAKYLSPPKQLNPDGNRLFIPANFPTVVLADASKPIYLTESEKGALKGCQEGFATIAVTGVWGWRKRGDPDGKVIADLFLVNWKGRDAYVLFDSDAVTNPMVQRAEAALAEELERRGARVHVIRLPEPDFEEAKEWHGKFGLDDLLVARGADALNSLLLTKELDELPFGCEPITTLLAQPETEQRWLVDGLWPLHGCGFFAGEPKTMKSFLALLLAICIVTGRLFLGRAVTRGAVILVDEENDRGELKKRARMLAIAMGVEHHELAGLRIIRPSELRLDRPELVERFGVILARFKPRLVIFDPLVRLHSREENDASAMGPILTALRALEKRHELAIVVVHHFKKKGPEEKSRPGTRLRGSGDLYGWMDSAFYFEADGKSISIEFECRYSAPAEPMRLRVVANEDSIRFVPEDELGAGAMTGDGVVTGDINQRIVAHLRAHGPTNRSDLSKALGVSGATAKDAVESLEGEGVVTTAKKQGSGRGRMANIVSLAASGTAISDNLLPLRGETSVRNGGHEHLGDLKVLPNNELESPEFLTGEASEIEFLTAEESGNHGEDSADLPDYFGTDPDADETVEPPIAIAAPDLHGRPPAISDKPLPPKGESEIRNSPPPEIAAAPPQLSASPSTPKSLPPRRSKRRSSAPPSRTCTSEGITAPTKSGDASPSAFGGNDS